MRFMFGLLIVLLLLPVVAAQEPQRMTLLAVREVNGTFEGSVADLFFETHAGQGRVFLETSPLTKIDTQISTRFAKEIACNYFDLNCGQTDFIYTIKSDSTIIGGPSAGGALAALSAAGMLGLALNESVAVTGTINSGGLIGPVGGLQAKIDAANEAGIGLVLIPAGTRFTDHNRTNESVDLVEYGETLGINVVEVRDLNDVLEHFTGERLLEENGEVVANSEYQTIMEGVSEELCDRGEGLKSELEEYELDFTDRADLVNRSNRIAEARETGAHYSSASYCFGLNIRLRSLLYEKQNLSTAKILSKAEQLRKDISRVEMRVRERELQTITDLQTFSIVIERLNEANRFLERVDIEDDKLFLLAFAEERYVSAVVWARFFAMSGREYELNKEVLKQSCFAKVQEAKERVEYLKLFLTQGISNIEENIGRAESQSEDGEYALCLIQASEAKANANAILSTFGIVDNQLEDLIERKFSALEGLISRTVEKQAFPILGFSYYQYAKSLKELEPASSLLYSEYALELSNLDIYFEEEIDPIETRENDIVFALSGFLVGFIAAFGVIFILKKKK
jgi:uncharacterized protein